MTKPEPLLQGHRYHIYNRGDNLEMLFRSPENYRFFLQRYVHYIEPVAATYAYCLLPDHFHFLVSLRTEEEQVHWCKEHQEGTSKRSQLSLPHHAFRKLFISYALSFNRLHGRSGGLFEKPFKRRRVDDDRTFTTLLTYIHHNPQKHGLVDDFRLWPWSSYGTLLSDLPTSLEREAVWDWFGSLSGFSDAHDGDVEEGLIAGLIEEDWV